MNHVVRVLATARDHVVGEGSGVSTSARDGGAAADGGSVAAGFGVNATGTDGCLTSNRVTASGSTLGSVETFSQTTGAVSTDVSSSDQYATINGGCAGLFANDVGVYDDFNPATQTDTFSVLNPVATGTAGGTWPPPPPPPQIFSGADNQSGRREAGLAAPGPCLRSRPAAIPGTGDFLVQEVASPDFFGGAPNNNSMSSIIVTDEHGNVLNRFEQFNFFNIFLLDVGDYVQASSATSTAFTLGPSGQQLYPFTYSGH